MFFQHLNLQLLIISKSNQNYLTYKHENFFTTPQSFKNLEYISTHFEANSLITSDRQLIIVLTEFDTDTCFLLATFDPPNYPSDDPFSITFKAEEIINQDNEDDNKDDNEHVVTVITITSIVCLIILYYLLLLFND